MIVIKMKETQISPSSDGRHGWPGEGVEWQRYYDSGFSGIIWLGVVVKSIWLHHP